MREKMLILSNALVITTLGIKIEFYNRLLTALFRKRKLPRLCIGLDRRLTKLRTEFILTERRHLSIICLDI